MAKNERVKIYNKGGRMWPLADGKDKDNKLIMVECAPGKSIELNKRQAEKLVKDYPHEFLMGEPVQKTNDNKKLKAEVAKLTAENKELKFQIEGLSKALADKTADKLNSSKE